jgi:hypothetical protein
LKRNALEAKSSESNNTTTHERYKVDYGSSCQSSMQSANNMFSVLNSTLPDDCAICQVRFHKGLK